MLKFIVLLNDSKNVLICYQGYQKIIQPFSVPHYIDTVCTKVVLFANAVKFSSDLEGKPTVKYYYSTFQCIVFFMIVMELSCYYIWYVILKQRTDIKQLIIKSYLICITSHLTKSSQNDYRVTSAN